MRLYVILFIVCVSAVQAVSFDEFDDPPTPDASIDPDRFVQLSIINTAGFLTIDSATVGAGEFVAHLENQSAPYALEIISSQGSVLYETPLNLPGGVSILNFPYFNNAVEVRIMKDSIVDQTYSLALYVPFCGNGLCNNGESSDSCGIDCPLASPTPLIVVTPSPTAIPLVMPTPTTLPSPRTVSASSRSAPLYFIVIAGALIALLILVIVLNRVHRPPLQSWVVRQLRSGKPLPKIRNELLSSGYKESEVDDLLDDVLKE